MKKLLFIFITSILFAQAPPHPKLLEKIKSGEIEAPYAFKNRVELRERGIGNGWASEELKRQNTQATCLREIQ